MDAWQATNKKAMDFLVHQVNTDDNSTFQAGRFYGCCEALCMAGVITANQWQQLDDLKSAKDLERVNARRPG